MQRHKSLQSELYIYCRHANIPSFVNSNQQNYEGCLDSNDFSQSVACKKPVEFNLLTVRFQQVK